MRVSDEQGKEGRREGGKEGRREGGRKEGKEGRRREEGGGRGRVSQYSKWHFRKGIDSLQRLPSFLPSFAAAAAVVGREREGAEGGERRWREAVWGGGAWCVWDFNDTTVVSQL